MEINEKFMGPQSKRTMRSINETSCVLGTVIVNSEGFPETTTLDSMSAASYATQMRNLSMHSNNALKEIDADNDVVALRMITKTTEVMVTPDREFHLIVVVLRKHTK